MSYCLFLTCALLSSVYAPKQAATWTYSRSVDASGSVVYKATVRSPTVVDLGYPYGRGAVATLTLRSKGASTSAYIEFASGSINRSFQNGITRLRFDGQPARTLPLTAAANGRANIVFIEADGTFLESLKRAKQLKLDLQFTGQPNRQLVFPTAGLRWPH